MHALAACLGELGLRCELSVLQCVCSAASACMHVNGAANWRGDRLCTHALLVRCGRVACMQDFFADPQKTVKQVVDWLGLPPVNTQQALAMVRQL